MSRKPSKNSNDLPVVDLEKLYNSQLKRLNNLINKALTEEITFKQIPIPEKPETLTPEYIDKLKSIKYEDIKLQGYKWTKGIGLVPYTETETPKEMKQPLKHATEKVKRETVNNTPNTSVGNPSKTTVDYSSNIPVDNLAYDGLIVLQNVYSILDKSPRKTANLLTSVIQREIHKIEEQEETNYTNATIILGEKMLDAPEKVIEDALIVVTSSEKEIVRNSAYNVAELIVDDISFIRGEIDNAVKEDFPDDYKHKSYRKKR